MTLRIERSRAAPGEGSLRLRLRDGGNEILQVESLFSFALSPGDRERVRTFWETAPAGARADSLEARLAIIGEDLFRAVFVSERALRIWQWMEPSLPDARIEIVDACADERTAVPWELLREPSSGLWLARESGQFVRGNSIVLDEPLFQPDSAEQLRVLAVLALPSDLGELGFRPSARQLVETARGERVRIDVLRPPTLNRLAGALLDAESAGEPYHVVHFDGLAVCADLSDEKRLPAGLRRAALARTDTVPAGRRGYLVFDHAQDSSRVRLADAAALAETMGESRAPAIVLNDAAPFSGPDAESNRLELRPAEAFRLLAAELSDFGLTAAAVSPYSLPGPEIAAWFGEFYVALSEGASAGEAAARARKAAPPTLSAAIAVHEGAPAPLLAHVATRREAPARPASRDRAADAVPREMAVARLDRALQTSSCVLLHGPAGAGKTVAAEQLVDWLDVSGGLDGPVLRTSLTEHRSLGAILDQLAASLGGALRALGIDWERMGPEERLETTLHVLEQAPALWILDRFQAVRAPGSGAPAWDGAEAQRLVHFLERLTETPSKALLLSRDEEEWLGRPIRRVALGPLDDSEAARAVALRFRGAGFEPDPVLTRAIARFSEGNPFALRLSAVQAAAETGRAGDPRAAMTTLARMAINRATSATAVEAALGDVLGNGFTDAERELLALIRLFRGIVDLDRLAAMVAPHRSWALREANEPLRKSLRREPDSAIERACRYGLLRPIGDRLFVIETGAEERLEALFAARFPAPAPRTGDAGPPPEDPAERVELAFVQAYDEWSQRLQAPPAARRPEDRARAEANEGNLRHALRIAQRRGWREHWAGPARLLGELYETSSRASLWQDLIEWAAGESMDPATRGPVPGHEPLWRIVIEQRVRLESRRQSHHWAMELQGLAVAWERRRAAAAIDTPFDRLEASQRESLMGLAASLNRLGAIARSASQPLPEVESEAIELCEKLGDDLTAAGWTYQLATDYTEAPSIRDLGRAERWLRRGLEYLPDRHPDRPRFMASLGLVAWERFRAARQAGQAEGELIRLLAEARQSFQQAVENDAPEDHESLARHLLLLGHASYSMGDIERAVPSYRESIRHDHARGDLLSAARTRFSLAIALRDTGRLGEARRYAVAAFDELRKFDGSVSADLFARARRLVMNIEERIEGKRQRSRARDMAAGGRWS